MGSLTDYFTFMTEEPRFLNDTKKTLHHITITDALMKKRSELKLYKEEKDKTVL